jgi:hypothetical protein
MIGDLYNFSVNIDNPLPILTVRKKVYESEDWKKALSDGLEAIGLQQFRENLPFANYYRMIDGKMSYQELRDAAPHLKDLQQLLDGVGVPTFLKHYDITGPIVNALTGQYTSMSSKFHIQDIGEVAQNEFLRFRDQKLEEEIMARIDDEIKIKLAESGFSPEGKRFSSEQEQQAFLQQMQQKRQEFTPKETLESASTNFKTAGTRWAEATKTALEQRHKLHKFRKNEFKDKIITGRCFREYKIGFDSYYPVRWHPINAFTSKEVEETPVHKGQYAGRVIPMLPSDVINKHGHRISTKTQEKLLGGNENWKNFISDSYQPKGISDAIFGPVQNVPFQGYYDYQTALNIEDFTGQPMGEQMVIGNDGSTVMRDRYLSRNTNNIGLYKEYAQAIRPDFKHRNDLCLVTEAYIRCYTLFGYLTYENEFGRIVTEEVTEDILKDFLKENRIKQTYTESIVDAMESKQTGEADFESGTLKWFWKPTVFEVVKIRSNNLDQPVYLTCQPCEHQIKGESMFDVYLPVVGQVGKSIVPKIYPYQSQFNLCMNQMYNMLEKEIGIFFLMDVGFIPSEFQGFGDTKDALFGVMEAVKESGIFPVATSGDAQRDKNHFQNFASYDLSYTQNIKTRIEIAEVCKNKAYEVIGINPSAQMQPSQYSTATGVKMSNEAMYSQVSDIFEEFYEFEADSLEILLSVAQYCESNNKDLTVHYTKSDLSLGFLKVSDPDFPLRRFGILPVDDPGKRKKFEDFKSYLLQTNTVGTDMVEIARFFYSDSMLEIMDIAKRENERRQQERQADAERQGQLLEKDSQLKEQAKQSDWERNEITKQRDRENKIVVEGINARGRATDKQSDDQGFAQIQAAEDRALQQNDIEQKYEMSNNRFRLDEQKHSDDMNFKMEKLKLEAEKLKVGLEKEKIKRDVATINYKM